jgi:hypothetical protein
MHQRSSIVLLVGLLGLAGLLATGCGAAADKAKDSSPSEAKAEAPNDAANTPGAPSAASSTDPPAPSLPPPPPPPPPAASPDPWANISDAATSELVRTNLPDRVRYHLRAPSLFAEHPDYALLRGQRLEIAYPSDVRGACVVGPTFALTGTVNGGRVYFAGHVRWQGAVAAEDSDPLLFQIVARVEKPTGVVRQVGTAVRASVLGVWELVHRDAEGAFVYKKDRVFDGTDASVGLNVDIGASDRVAMGLCGFGAGVELTLDALSLDAYSVLAGPP